MCGQVTFIQLHNDVTGVFGNELRLGVLLNGNLTGLWEPELLIGDQILISSKNMIIHL